MQQTATAREVEWGSGKKQLHAARRHPPCQHLPCRLRLSLLSSAHMGWNDFSPSCVLTPADAVRSLQASLVKVMLLHSTVSASGEVITSISASAASGFAAAARTFDGTAALSNFQRTQPHPARSAARRRRKDGRQWSRAWCWCWKWKRWRNFPSATAA